jgi:lysophospholipid acyltransferase (LPLAT)-like uncharacterized protein
MPDRIRLVEGDNTREVADAIGAAPPTPPSGRRGADASPAPHARWARVLGGLGAAFLRLHHATWRTRVEGLAEFDRMLAAGETVLLIFWHGKYLPLFPILRGRDACVLTAQSFRGQVLSEIGRRFGFDGVHLPQQGELRAFALMRRALASRRAGGIAADGPLGPNHVVKSGVIELASRSGCALLPVSTASRRKWILKRRWDRMEWPAPFARVALVLGPPLHVPPDLLQREVAGWKERLRDALEAADRTARAMIEGD